MEGRPSSSHMEARVPRVVGSLVEVQKTRAAKVKDEEDLEGRERSGEGGVSKDSRRVRGRGDKSYG